MYSFNSLNLIQKSLGQRSLLLSPVTVSRCHLFCGGKLLLSDSTQQETRMNDWDIEWVMISCTTNDIHKPIYLVAVKPSLLLALWSAVVQDVKLWTLYRGEAREREREREREHTRDRHWAKNITSKTTWLHPMKTTSTSRPHHNEPA